MEAAGGVARQCWMLGMQRWWSGGWMARRGWDGWMNQGANYRREDHLVPKEEKEGKSAKWNEEEEEEYTCARRNKVTRGPTIEERIILCQKKRRRRAKVQNGRSGRGSKSLACLNFGSGLTSFLLAQVYSSSSSSFHFALLPSFSSFGTR